MSISYMTSAGPVPIPTKGGGAVSLETLVRITNLEQELEQLKQTVASDVSYGLSKVTNATDVTQENGIALSAMQNNASVDGTLANLIQSMSTKETVDITWNDSNFLGSYAEKSAIKINGVVSIHVAKFNGVSSIQTGKDIVIGKLNNNRPSHTCYGKAISGNMSSSNPYLCGLVMFKPNGDIVLFLEKQCDWLLFIDVVYIK